MTSKYFPKKPWETAIDLMFDMPHEPDVPSTAEIVFSDSKQIYERPVLAISEYYHYICSHRDRDELDQRLTPQMATFFRMRFQLGNGIKPPRFEKYFVAIAGCEDRDRIIKCVTLWHTILLPLADDPNEQVWSGALDCRKEVHKLVLEKLTNIWLDDDLPEDVVEYAIKLAGFAGILHTIPFVDAGTSLSIFSDTLGILVTRLQRQPDVNIFVAFHAWLEEVIRDHNIDKGAMALLLQGFNNFRVESEGVSSAEEAAQLKELIDTICRMLENVAA